jgi:hypothetical protein
MTRRFPIRRLPLLLAATGVAIAFAGTSAAADNNGNGNGPGGNVTLLTSSLPAMAPGQAGWVSLNWLGDTRNATSFQVTATEPTGTVTIGYPTNTGAFSAPYRESQLLSGGTDYTSFYLHVAPGASAPATITFHLSYDEQNGNGGGNGANKHYTTDFTLQLPVVQASGAAIALATPSVSVPRATPTWVKISATASAAGVTGVHITAAGPAGLVVVYPGDGTSTSFNADPNLDKGETDYCGLRLDASAVALGSYTLTLTIAYGSGQSVTRSLALVVT